MSSKRIVIVLADGFEEVEALAPADVLKRLGCQVELAGLNKLTVSGTHGFKVGADLLLKDADALNADAVILPGGLPGATNLRDDDALTKILQARNEAGKLCAAICAAPAVFGHAGIVNGRTVTGYPGCERLSGSPDLHFTGAMAERDGNLITGKGPGAAFVFAAEIAYALGFSKSSVAELFAGMFVNA